MSQSRPETTKAVDLFREGTKLAAIVSALAASPEGLTNDEICEAIYPDGGPEWARRCVYVNLCKIRRRLEGTGWQVCNSTKDRRYRLIKTTNEGSEKC